MSFIWPQVLERCYSELNGKLEVALENGRLVLNSANSNYSYGSLQKVFETAFRLVPPSIPENGKILMLGMGGGCVVPLIQQMVGSDALIHAVEVDPEVVRLGRKYFPEAYAEIYLTEADAMDFLATAGESFDLILVDLFIDRELAPGCLSDNFIDLLARALAPEGVLYHNLMLGEDGLEEALSSYRKSFDHLRLLRVLTLNQMIIARQG